MSGARHTPGPWVADDDENIMTNDGQLAIATVMLANDFPCMGDDDEEARERLQIECEANADLLAAAPDLLEALQGLLPEGWDDGTMDHMPGVAAARAAIAKATGQDDAA